VRSAFFEDTVTGHILTLAEETRYTLTVSGGATDICGRPLDGNFDGTGGTNFMFSFVTGAMAEDTCQYDSCACQSDSCSCQFEGPAKAAELTRARNGYRCAVNREVVTARLLAIATRRETLMTP